MIFNFLITKYDNHNPMMNDNGFMSISPIAKNNSILKRSFSKRVCVFILAIIIAFNCVCKPREVKAEAITGTVLTGMVIGAVISAAAGAIIPDAWDAVKSLFKKKNPNATDEEMSKYFRDNITVNGDGNYVLSADLQEFAKDLRSEYDEKVNCVYGWTYPLSDLVPEEFAKGETYNGLKEFMEANSEYMFVQGNGNQYWCYKISDILGAVAPTISGALLCDFYDKDWNKVYPVQILFTSMQNWEICCEYHKGDGGIAMDNYVPSDATTIDGAIKEFTDLGKFTYVDMWGSHPNTYVTLRANQWPSFQTILYSEAVSKTLTNQHVGFASKFNRIEVYKSLNDLKRGTKEIGGYLPSGANNGVVTPSAVDSYNKTTYNYYGGDKNNPKEPPSSGGGSGNGNGDNDSGSGLGGAIGDLLRSLFGGLAEILKGAIEGIAQLFTQLLDAIKDIQQYLTKDVAEFFKDLLSFMPEAWVARITLGFSLVMLAFVIRILKG